MTRYDVATGRLSCDCSRISVPVEIVECGHETKLISYLTEISLTLVIKCDYAAGRKLDLCDVTSIVQTIAGALLVAVGEGGQLVVSWIVSSTGVNCLAIAS